MKFVKISGFLIFIGIFAAVALLLKAESYATNEIEIILENFECNSKEGSVLLRGVIKPKNADRNIIISTWMPDYLYIHGYRHWAEEIDVRRGIEKKVFIEKSKTIPFEIKGKYAKNGDTVIIDFGGFGRKDYVASERLSVICYIVPFKRYIIDSDEFEHSNEIDIKFVN